MKLNPGIITRRLAESKAFYLRLGFELVFENDWYVLLQLNGQELAFMQPELDFQKPMFRVEYAGCGVWLTLMVRNAGDDDSWKPSHVLGAAQKK